MFTTNGKFTLMSSFIETCIPNNLSSPEARGSVGTVAQEEIDKITTPLTKTAIHMDLIIVNLFLIEVS
jgi:hypothetical protein